MIWVRAWHIIAMVAWFAGLFYLPRLFVYHVKTHDEVGYQQFCHMERRLYRYIMWPAASVTTLLGCVLLIPWVHAGLLPVWLWAKLGCVMIVWGYHLYCGRYVQQFQVRSMQHTQQFFRFFNEVPTLLLIVIIVLVVVKPG
ncbi:MAG: hypothetical protein A3J38_03925 [Gammaproteobacteria bacterium RIFCSPHIGHO2_12_FULL_45_9]|nr:MAG: hypothetical protein A3J38_03925 [Gammaproteobacteria bacterium RIFCSPHIGHO2_12_FULL_45_9]